MKRNFNVFFAAIMMIAMVFSFCACGEDGSQEETVEITTLAEEATQPTKADNISSYEAIYDEYKGKLKKADDRDALDDAFEKGKTAMTDAMLDSSADDQDTYTKWFNKLNEVYSECARAMAN